MNPRLNMLAIPGLRWVLAPVVLLESAHFAVSPAAPANWPQPVFRDG